MRTFKVLDAFSCKGGAGIGYIEGGAEVTGVDKKDYSDEYPGTFVHGDAVEYIRDCAKDFDLVHMSAPCQAWTRGNAPRRDETGTDRRWPTYIEAARDAVIDSGVPFAIENVEGAAKLLRSPILLCGRMFDLHAYDTHPDAVGMKLILDRHRLFEFGNMPQPVQPRHDRHVYTTGIGQTASGFRYTTGAPHVAGVYGGARRDPWEAKYVRHGGYVPKDIKVLQSLLDVTHISTERELFEAIPPAYTRWVLHQVQTLIGYAVAA